MPDREKYIVLLSKTVKTVKEFSEDVPITISLESVEDILALLKEQENDIHHMGLIIEEYEKELKKQEAAEPTWQQGRAYCGSCGKRIPLKIGARFCHKCGKRIEWESRRSSDVV